MGDSWHVVYTSPRAEGLAEQSIREIGGLVYVPRETVLVTLAHGRKKATRLKPLFPRYLFTQIPALGLLRNLEGVEHAVAFGGTACTVADSYVRELQQAEYAGAFDRRPKPAPEWKIGDRVRLPNGLLAAVVGVAPGDRVTVLMTFLGAQREQVVKGNKLERAEG